MSRSILISDLRARGQRQIEELWETARQEIRALEKEISLKATDEEDRCDLAARQANQAVRRKKVVAAQREASAVITRSEEELYNRLYDLALKMVVQSWTGKRDDLLASLAGEIPDGAWKIVRVHPEDARAAGKIFPKLTIEEDNSIVGGLELVSGDGRTSMINTLNKRLEKAWPWLGPEILREVAKNA